MLDTEYVMTLCTSRLLAVARPHALTENRRSTVKKILKNLPHLLLRVSVLHLPAARGFQPHAANVSAFFLCGYIYIPPFPRLVLPCSFPPANFFVGIQSASYHRRR